MLKTYYAYLAIAGGYLLHLIGGQLDHWLVYVVAFGLIALGALELRRFSHRYYQAAAAAIGNSVLCIVLYMAGIWLSGAVLKLLAIAAYCILSALLLRGMAAQRRSCGLGAGVENVLLVALVLSGLGVVVLLFVPLPVMQLTAQGGAAHYFDWESAVVTLVNTCVVLFQIGMIFDVFRLQKQALQSEAGQ